MRRHFQAAPVVRQALSVEEEAIMLDDISAQAAEINAGNQDVERMADIIVTMGDVRTVTDTTPEVGTAEQELISAVADMAVAGTDADPESIAQDMLPSDGLSTEGFFDKVSEKLKSIWEKIKAMILSMWESIKKFFSSDKSKIEAVEAKLEKVQEIYEEVKVERMPPHEKTINEEPKAAAPKAPKGPRQIDFWGTAGNIAIDGKVVEPEKLAGEIRNLMAAVKKGNTALTAGWPHLYDNMKKSADGMASAIKANNASTYQDFLDANAKGGEEHRKLMQKIAHDGGFQTEGKEKVMLADFAYLTKEHDSHSGGWNDVSVWVEFASRGYNSATSHGIREIPMDHIDDVFKVCKEGLALAKEWADMSDVDRLVDSRKKAVEDAMQHLSEIKPTDEAAAAEQDALKSLTMGIISGGVQQLGFAVLKAASLGRAICQARLTLIKVTDTACSYAERSLAPAMD